MLKDPLDFPHRGVIALYSTKSKDEIVPALAMEIFMVWESFYDFKAYKGCEKHQMIVTN
jgi:hypothetical protein